MKQQRSTKRFCPKEEIENFSPQVLSQFQESAEVLCLKKADRYLGSPKQTSDKSLRLQAGQIVIEYVLMLLVAVALALLIINSVVSRQAGNEGFLIKAWGGIIKTIGNDKTDEITP